MKRIICHQMHVISARDLPRVHGAGNSQTSQTSRSDAVQTAMSGDRGCVAAARDRYEAQKNRQGGQRY